MRKILTVAVEWPTVALAIVCNAAWFWLALEGQHLQWSIWIAAASLVTALYWSLVHEIVHGHPTRLPIVNYALVWLPLGWVYSLGRFRDGHLEHHATGALTDPFDDPETWYLAERDWNRAGRIERAMLTFNNTLLGRLVVGPLITFWRMIAGDAAAIVRGGQNGWVVARDWLLHLPGVIVLAAIVSAWSQVPFWQFAVAAYCGVAIILIRTFLEHQAAENQHERTVIIEDRGLLAFLFLFNNLHVVHHTRPGLAWYRLPGFYKRHREQFIRRNRGYVYPSYWAVFRKHFLTPKEPVAHPTMRRA